MDSLIENLKPLFKSIDENFENALDILFKAHINAAKENSNASSEIFYYSMMGSGKLINGIASGLLSIGGPHAPLADARLVLFDQDIEKTIDMADSGQKISGFGNSFFKETIDPSWKEFAIYVKNNMPEQWRRISEISMHVKGGKIPVNAAGLTAAFADFYQMEYGSETILFVLPRVTAWTSMIKFS